MVTKHYTVLISLSSEFVQHVLRNEFRKIFSMNQTSNPFTGPGTEYLTFLLREARYHP